MIGPTGGVRKNGLTTNTEVEIEFSEKIIECGSKHGYTPAVKK
jgi:hypothetical protein